MKQKSDRRGVAVTPIAKLAAIAKQLSPISHQYPYVVLNSLVRDSAR
ncbi:MAG: hypothetical protein R6U67_10625 [Sodalinema sp.]